MDVLDSRWARAILKLPVVTKSTAASAKVDFTLFISHQPFSLHPRVAVLVTSKACGDQLLTLISFSFLREKFYAGLGFFCGQFAATINSKVL
jgi:hypothetical protein